MVEVYLGIGHLAQVARTQGPFFSHFLGDVQWTHIYRGVYILHDHLLKGPFQSPQEGSSDGWLNKMIVLQIEHLYYS